MTESLFPDRLTQLRARWEANPASRIFLQLAEEYRHLGRVQDALEILDKGLEKHPGYLNALVAKGRCYLELGKGDEARIVLERAVQQDATLKVTHKLLVRAYLETGDPVKARERLDLYSLLIDNDPEIEDLRRRIRQIEEPAAPEKSSPAAEPFGSTLLPPGEGLPPAGAADEASLRDLVFISYSHRDKNLIEELLTHLKPQMRSGLKAWSDKQLAPGSKWLDEIQAGLSKTCVAVLLVSPDFLASDFIHEHEFGPLLKEAEAGGVKILWVPIRASVWEETPLQKYQAVVPPDRPLAQMDMADRDEAWVRVCKEIKRAANS